jgi:hypothetical protein
MKTQRDDEAGGKCTTLEYIRKYTRAELDKADVQDSTGDETCPSAKGATSRLTGGSVLCFAPFTKL